MSAGEEPSVIDPGETLVAAGTKVTATLTLNAAEGQTLALQRITGQSPDGSWAMLPVEVNTAQPAAVSEGKTIEFTMPASEVILTYTISSKANIKDKPTADSPTEEPVEVPEIAWPGISPEKPVLVITHQIDEKKLELLSQQLQLLPVAGKEEGTVTKLVDISLQLENGERVQPGSPVTVTYPYPQGTDARWNFCIVHQISDAGQAISYETIYPESLHIGLRFQVSSFSPFAILYTPPFLPEGTDEPVRVESISLDRTSLTLRTDGSDRLSVTFTPADATDKRVVWSSDNESVLTVSDDGMLTAVSPGNVLVTARSVNGGFQATCRITVESASNPDPDPDPGLDPDP